MPPIAGCCPGLCHVTGNEASQRYELPKDRNLFGARPPTLGAGDDAEAVKEQIRVYFHNTWEIYEKVFECLSSEESFYIAPVHKLRHPMIFYYGHTAAFYINKLSVAGLTPRLNPKFEEMFAVGVDEMSWDDLNEAHYSWPTVREVSEYRRAVRDHVDHMMRDGKLPLSLPLTFANSTANDGNAFWWVMCMGAEHERIHLETASVHVRELPMRLVNGAMSSFWRRCPDWSEKAPANELVEVAGGKVSVGRGPDSPLYGWDCDYSDGQYTQEVAPFKASKCVVSNAEFFSFMKAGGYGERRYWDEEGWNWVTWRKPQHPWFWVKDDRRADGYALRLQVEEVDLPWNWPVEVNHLEARAFCRFKSEEGGKELRLPTEAEWLLLRDRYVKGDIHEWAAKAPGNVNLEHFRSSCPVDRFAHGPFYDIVGNVWQHTETPVYPYPGYRVHPFYDDFSMPTFDGRHCCMKGGAWVSSGNEATRDARYAFRRHFFQYIGIRYVAGYEVDEQRHLGNVLGMDPEVDAVTDVSYRSSFGPVPNPYVAVAEHVACLFKEHCHGMAPRRALDLFCGAGRCSFELTRVFEEVIGSDFTARRLMPAFSMRERGVAQYSVVNARGVREARRAESTDYAWAATRERALFYQADPTNLHAHMANFDAIVAWNCLERSYRPAAIPPHLLSRLNRGGLLVIGGDFQWSEEFTRRSEWLCGAGPHDPRDPFDEIFKALGGAEAVRRVGGPFSAAVVEATNDVEGRISLIAFQAFTKN